jgi:hypothetical protein
MNQQEKDNTARLIDGNWLFQKDNKEYRLFISPTDCTLQIFEENKNVYEEEFYHKTGWFGEELLFTDKGKYFATFADENKLNFGEREKNNERKLLWYSEFKRI